MMLRTSLSRWRLSAVLLLLGAFAVGLRAEILRGRVVGVADGDTITVLDGQLVQHRVRLVGIDAPEKSQPFGSRSKQHLSEMVFGKEVGVTWKKRDRYKRVLGKVMVEGQDANLEQVGAGLAWHYKRYSADQDTQDRLEYEAAEKKAQSAGLGLWSESFPTPPWEYRELKR